MGIEGLVRFVGSLACEHSCRNSCVAKNPDLHVGIFSAGPFRGFRGGYGGSFAVDDLALGCRLDEIIGQQRSDQIRVVGFLRLKPLLFQRGDGFFGAAFFALRPQRSTRQNQTDQTPYRRSFHSAPLIVSILIERDAIGY